MVLQGSILRTIGGRKYVCNSLMVPVMTIAIPFTRCHTHCFYKGSSNYHIIFVCADSHCDLRSLWQAKALFVLAASFLLFVSLGSSLPVASYLDCLQSGHLLYDNWQIWRSQQSLPLTSWSIFLLPSKVVLMLSSLIMLDEYLEGCFKNCGVIVSGFLESLCK